MTASVKFDRAALRKESKVNGTTFQATTAQSPAALLSAMDISDAEIARRKQWLQFNEEDEERIRKISDFHRRIQEEVIEELYTHFLAFEETRKFFSDPQLLERVKSLQKE